MTTMYGFLVLLTAFLVVYLFLVQVPDLAVGDAFLSDFSPRIANPILSWHDVDALDANGNPGYIHDTKYLRKNPLPFQYYPDLRNESVCDLPPGKGIEGPGGIWGLRKIRISTVPTATRVLCIVYTHSNVHERLLQAVAETYGPRCDGFLAASNVTNVTLGAVNILHPGPEAYGNMWQKVRSIWMYVYKHYRNDYEWFHIGGDNMYVIADNLRLAAHEESIRQPSTPIYMGGAMVLPPRRKWRLCGGGSGYTLNRLALTQMMKEFHQDHCAPYDKTSKEDVYVANCLRPNIALCTHSQDDQQETRYHPYDVQFHSVWKKWKASNWHWEILLRRHHINAAKEGFESISASSVSFHLTGHKNYTTNFRDMGLRRYHALLYGYCTEHKYMPFNTSVKIEVKCEINNRVNCG